MTSTDTSQRSGILSSIRPSWSKARRLREQLDQQQQSIDHLREAIVAREDVVRAREATVVEREVQLAQAHAEVNRLNIAAEALKTIVIERERTISKCEHELERARGEVARLAKAVDGFETEKLEQDGADPLLNKTQKMTAGSKFSAKGINTLIAEWQIIADSNRRLSSRGGQQSIAPYIVEKFIHDRPGRLIISNVEARDWYDNDHGIELPHLLRFGMIRWGDTVFDCGSNQGINALNYSRLIGEAGRVLAFDPFPMNIEIAKFNAYLNGITNIDFIQAGLSDSSSRLTVAVADQNVGVGNDNEEDSIAIDLVPLDIFSSMRPDYIKIDVEGAEVNVLQGAQTILSQTPALYIEVHPQFLPRFGKSPMDIFKYIDLGKYHCYLDHPGRPFHAEYFAEYEITEGCALYFVPRSRERIVRHHAT